MKRLYPLALLSPLLLAACVTAPPGAPVETPPATVAAPPAAVGTPPPVMPPPPALPPATPGVSPPPQPPGERDGIAQVLRLIPPRAPERNAWAEDIYRAFAALSLPQSRENLCAVVAVIEQESSFVADPPVPGLGRIVREELYKRAAGYLVPPVVVDVALLKRSRDGRTYGQRIDALRTEHETNTLFNEMVAELPDFARALGNKNPIRTAGPMQVSVAFAEDHLKTHAYPYPRHGSVRDEVFTRRGGVYFGVAILLDYPVSYPAPLYRFADFNAGRYASRNAAFQSAVARVAHTSLSLDGDLLRYQDGKPVREPSSTEMALRGLAPRLNLKPDEIRRDLLLEKTYGFTQTPTWSRLMALADRHAGRPLPREVLPQIRLQSPKITRKLSTEWFARRVDGRWQTCMNR